MLYADCLEPEKLPCQTAVFDTIDAIEVFIRERVCRIHALKTIEGASTASDGLFFGKNFNAYWLNSTDSLTAAFTLLL